MKRIILILNSLFLLAVGVEAADLTSTTCPGSGCVDYNVTNQSSIGIQITNTWNGTITFQSSIDGTTFVSQSVVSVADTTGARVTTTTANGVFQTTVAGLRTIRVNFTVRNSGTATVTPIITQARSGIGFGGGSSTTPGGNDTDVQFNDGGAFGGSDDLTFTTLGLTNLRLMASGAQSAINGGSIYGTPTRIVADVEQAYTTDDTPDGLYSGIASFIDVSFADNSTSGLTAIYATASIGQTTPVNKNFSVAWGAALGINYYNTGTLAQAYGVGAAIQNLGAGTITDAWLYKAEQLNNGGGGTITNAFSYYAAQHGSLATNAYSFWSDEPGVFRIKSDNTFNSVYQAIPALYNPQFTKYTPGATSYERWALQWEDNIAVFTTEKGSGGGTLRAMRIGDTGVLVTINEIAAVGTQAVAVANVGANSCGTSAATIAGNDNFGAITVGATSATQCRITFVTAAANRRHCVASDETTAGVAATLHTAYVDSTHSDILGTITAGDVITYHCFAR